jgi:hypothetical protein
LDAALQAIVLILVLVTSLVAQTFLQPWRSQVANHGDSVMTSALIILLLCGAMVTEYPDYESIKVVGITIFGGFIAAAFLLMTMALVKRVHPTPYYQTFICHDSSESAAQTRVLKSIMQDNNAKDVFIDPSSEIAVAEHFDVAKCKTDRFVIYLTRGALRNTRCAGEIVLAHKSGKEIQVVQMPDFIHPTKEQLDNIEQYLDLSHGNLATHVISMAQVAETYRELLQGESTWMKIEEHPGGQQLRDVGQELGKHAASFNNLTVKCQKKPLPAPQVVPNAVVVISDPLDQEALSAASICVSQLDEKVKTFMTEGVNLVSQCSMDDMRVVRTCVARSRATVIFLSSGTFWSKPQLIAIMEAMIQNRKGEDAPQIIPVQMPGFKAPSKNYFKESLPTLLPNPSEDTLREVQKFLEKDYFHFNAGESEKVMQQQSDEIVRLIPRKGSQSTDKRTPSKELEN